MYIYVCVYTYELELKRICLKDRYGTKNEVTTKSCLRQWRKLFRVITYRQHMLLIFLFFLFFLTIFNNKF